ncbi:MAG TPA: alanine--glyoxylate aminotransferase family protein, partial [Gemmatimonadaceae bacterium]|nr:alanine--glyoxylate aminotransferase family protein [Gemmatimonadaceae bacterium]
TPSAPTSTMPLPTFGSFFLPGPTEVRPEILAALTRPMIAHRGRGFEELFARIEAGLRDVFLSARPVYVAACSASGMMEGAIRCAPAGRVLALVNGAFSERFAKIARACARDTDTLEVPWGGTFDMSEVESRLAAGGYAVVTVVHSETSTGVLTDVRTVTELAHRHGAMCLVDSVSGIAGAELRFDEWGLDFVLTGSQKALALPPGLAFAAASSEFVERARQVPDRGLYFDVVEYEAYAAKNQTPATPALSLLYALEAQLGDILREGIDRRWERHEVMRDATAAWLNRARLRLDLDLEILAPEGARSPTVTTITLPPQLTSAEVVHAVSRRGFTIGSGYGKLRETTFRIGHMGDHTIDSLRPCLAECEDALRDVGGHRW